MSSGRRQVMTAVMLDASSRRAAAPTVPIGPPPRFISDAGAISYAVRDEGLLSIDLVGFARARVESREENSTLQSAMPTKRLTRRPASGVISSFRVLSAASPLR